MPIEIEKRFILLSSRTDLIGFLTSQNIFFESNVVEVDTYFDGPNFIADKICLRIRTSSSGFVELTYKGPSNQSNQLKNFFIKEELNVKIADESQVDSLAKVLASLGFNKLVEVKKDREIFTGRDFVVSLDKLGNRSEYYLEIETNSNDHLSELQLFLSDLQSQLLLEENLKPYRDIILDQS